MAFSVKDFWSYTDDPSTLKDLVLLVAKPGGGGFSLINMTKEEFFRIAQDMAIQIDTPSGQRTFIDFGGGRKISYVGSTNTLIEEVDSKLISVPGQPATLTFSPASGLLSIGSASNEGTVVIRSATGGSANLKNIRGGTTVLNFDQGGVVQVNPITVTVDSAILVSTNYVVKLALSQWQAYYFDLIATVANLTIEMPTSPDEGDRVSLYFGGSAGVSDIDMVPGANIESPLTAASVGDRVTYMWIDSSSKWVPIS